jgi:GT2 family glycosyltransferase
MLSYVLPTRNRPERFQRTLAALGALSAGAHMRIGGGEVIVVDNASSPPLPKLPKALPNGLPVRALKLRENRGAAARNHGVAEARGDWIVMLDDDSHPMDSNHIDLLLEAPPHVAAIGAEIMLPDGSRERGGLPEVIIGCGAAIRRAAFECAGGYDPTFDYYAEEYDLCAKLLLAGWRIAHNPRFRVLHEKVAAGRDFTAILHRLVRNNAWVMQRYAPQEAREREIAAIVERYAQIAMKEHAARGFARGMSDLATTLQTQPRTPMPQRVWERFTGATAVREAGAVLAGQCVAITDEGKNSHVIRKVLAEEGAKVMAEPAHADVLVIGTLSPGPAQDALERNACAHPDAHIFGFSPFANHAAAKWSSDPTPATILA